MNQHPCSTCRGTCPCPLACHMPIEPIRRHLFTRRSRFTLTLPATADGWGLVLITAGCIAAGFCVLGAVVRLLEIF